MTDRATIARLIANDVRRAEASITSAVRDTSAFLVTLCEGDLADDLGAATLQIALERTSLGIQSLVESRRRIGCETHSYLEKVGRRIGLDETAWGEKPANIAQLGLMEGNDISPEPAMTDR
ncbi:hypothetical protein [Sphingomonas morindae]|uniref:Uncharacterized protein n=1 Tax=Sphingomonas morindae TaxID=1541170 RepID=A0ABY4XA43_9SPHN|nr:hypothetical protein [Sphingomonas morindae]USI73769.1 hypothetical protein LHA26_04685 [Sphingomonas morindae]